MQVPSPLTLADRDAVVKAESEVTVAAASLGQSAAAGGERAAKELRRKPFEPVRELDMMLTPFDPPEGLLLEAFDTTAGQEVPAPAPSLYTNAERLTASAVPPIVGPSYLSHLGHEIAGTTAGSSARNSGTSVTRLIVLSADLSR